MTRAPLYLRCDCHQPYHFVLIEDDPDIAGAYLVSVIATKSASFWHRLKWAAIHVLGRDHLTVGDVVLTPEDAARLKAFLDAEAAA